MPISWNEIRQNAIRFSREWSEECREDAEAKSFWDEFFTVFGMRRRLLATFEEPVRKTSGQYGYIDLFWRGVMLAEHKSRGKSLDKAESQAFNYIQDLAHEGRTDDLPRYVILSDFERVALYDLEPDNQADLPLFENRHYRKTEFPLKELHKHIQEFAFIAGYKQHRLRDEDPINIKAVEILGNLHDALAEGDYTGHDLERFLVRILFCLFAEDTGLFEPGTFTFYLVNKTNPDGSDLGLHLARLFEVLDTPPERRQKNLDELLAAFPYVNGDLFKERLGFADFNRTMREALVACTNFDWSRISPAIFGSLFQGVMDPKERRQTGGHYTSERDILKVINALFMDALRAEFGKIRHSKAMLKQFHQKLGTLRFFDPACGCGNFLVITYRELRLLEIEVLKALYGGEVQQELEVQSLSKVDVDAYTGIEIQEWPARIAEVAMWLMDHQMNLRLSEVFGQYFVRLPLRKAAHIHLGNALRLDWKAILPPDQCSYVLGNPPFIGHQWRTDSQKQDMDVVWGAEGRFGRLDYVTCWYKLAAAYIQGHGIPCAFVSTNSITQGEQVGILWAKLKEFGMHIHFAHRSFPWQSEARGKAHVHVVIIGFGDFDVNDKKIYDYEGGHQTVSEALSISPYLVEGSLVTLPSRTSASNGLPQMKKGSQPTDGGYLVLTATEREDLLSKEPAAEKWLRPYIGGEEMINGEQRWCLWLKSISPTELKGLPSVMERVANVKKSRLLSPTKSVRDFAEMPTLFTQDRQPDSDYLAVPEVSSETRRFIPIAFLPASIIASNKLQMIVGATKYHFGILSSTMHMAWMRVVSGRLESRYSYAPAVYNNFPWPENPAAKQKASVEAKAQAVLDARAKYPLSTLADLYDPLTMPADLVKAHSDLDRAVDACYRPQAFTSDRQRVEYLFALYERLATPLLPAEKKSRKRADRPTKSSANQVQQDAAPPPKTP